jgi:hypothetical protein
VVSLKRSIEEYPSPFIPHTRIYDMPVRTLPPERHTRFDLITNPVLKELKAQLQHLQETFLTNDGGLRSDYAGPGGLSKRELKTLGTLYVRYFNASIDQAKELSGHIKSIVNCTSEMFRLAALKGFLFELSAQDYILRSHPKLHVDYMPPIMVSYIGYNTDRIQSYIDDHTEEAVPLRRRVAKHFSDSRLEFDAAVEKSIRTSRKRKHDKTLPYVYEVKCYGTREVYKTPGQVNQILKYQAAIHQGLISGATLEIRGRISPQLIPWIQDMAPDVQVVFNLELPSGAPYRIPFYSGNNAIPVKNERNLDPADIEVVKTIRRLVEKDPHLLLETTLDAGQRLESVLTARYAIKSKDDTIDIKDVAYYKQKVYLRNMIFWDTLKEKDKSH